MKKLFSVLKITIFLIVTLFTAIALLPGCKGKVTPVVPVDPGVTKDTVVNNDWFCSTYEPPSPKGVNQAVAQNGRQWPTGSVLHVGFIVGTQAQRSWPIQAFTLWAQVANLKFDYPTAGPYDIRISFKSSDGAYSYIGTDCKSIPQNTATMNLGWTGLDVALHEIGHALSLLHEQSSPVGNICWNKQAVYTDLGGPPNNWSHTMVDNNVFFKYNQADVTNTEFDPLSIMEYQIPGAWTCNGTGIPGGKVLTEKDKFLIAKLYPGVVVPPPPPPPSGGVTLTSQQAAALYAKAVSASSAAATNLKAAQTAKNAADSVSVNMKKAFGL